MGDKQKKDKSDRKTNNKNVTREKSWLFSVVVVSDKKGKNKKEVNPRISNVILM